MTLTGISSTGRGPADTTGTGPAPAPPAGAAVRVLVVGGGMAAARLVHQLAAAADGAGPRPLRVTVLAEEPHPPYNRVLLAEVLAGRYPPQVIALPAPAAAVAWHGGVQVVRIDRGARRVRCGDGREFGYDVLVLSTGANPVLPPLRGLFAPGGSELPDGVHPFRTLDDCAALAAAVRPGLPAVVVGGGLLGVSAARALAACGARVLLAHQGTHLMDRHLDAEAGALLRDHLTGLGVEVHTECRARGVRTRPVNGPDGTAGRRVHAVELADGHLLDAGLAVLACGVRPRTGLARDAGLDVGTGIRVDDALRTSDPRIHAVGDCAEHHGTVYGLAGAAQEQADALARVLTGPRPTAPAYTGTRALTRLTLSGRDVLDLAAFGETAPRPGDDVVRLADATRGTYRKVVVRGDRLVGGVLVGALGTVGTLARAWEDAEALPSDDGPLLHLLTNDGGS
ncbi:NAD(P)/FAD-dependent oxidoreductase [Streptomyces sp. DB-54]